MATLDYLGQAALYRAAFNNGPDATILVAADGTILLCNTQAALFTGIDTDDLIGMKIESIIPPDARDNHRQHRAGYMSNPRHRSMGAGSDLALNILQTTIDGQKTIPVEINLAPVTVASLGVVVIATIRRRGGASWGES